MKQRMQLVLKLTRASCGGIQSFVLSNVLVITLFSLAFIIFSLAIVNEWKSFSVWSQVVYAEKAQAGIIVDERSNISRLVHIPRHYIMKPTFWVSKLSGVDVNKVFGFEIMFVVLASLLLLSNAIKAASRGRRETDILLLISLLGFISLMNGRMTWVILSMSAITWLQLTSSSTTAGLIGRAIVFIASLVLSAVSTGSFVIVYLVAFMWVVFYMRPILNLARTEKIVYLITMALLIPYMMIALVKNIEYFGGDYFVIVRILDHGYGKYIQYVLLPTGVLLALSVAFNWRIVFRLRKYCNEYPELILPSQSAILGISGGLFGYSTMTVAVPPLIFIASYLFSTYLNQDNCLRNYP